MPNSKNQQMKNLVHAKNTKNDIMEKSKMNEKVQKLQLPKSMQKDTTVKKNSDKNWLISKTDQIKTKIGALKKFVYIKTM